MLQHHSNLFEDLQCAEFFGGCESIVRGFSWTLIFCEALHALHLFVSPT